MQGGRQVLLLSVVVDLITVCCRERHVECWEVKMYEYKGEGEREEGG